MKADVTLKHAAGKDGILVEVQVQRTLMLLRPKKEVSGRIVLGTALDRRSIALSFSFSFSFFFLVGGIPTQLLVELSLSAVLYTSGRPQLQESLRSFTYLTSALHLFQIFRDRGPRDHLATSLSVDLKPTKPDQETVNTDCRRLLRDRSKSFSWPSDSITVMTC